MQTQYTTLSSNTKHYTTLSNITPENQTQYNSTQYNKTQHNTTLNNTINKAHHFTDNKLTRIHNTSQQPSKQLNVKSNSIHLTNQHKNCKTQNSKYNTIL